MGDIFGKYKICWKPFPPNLCTILRADEAHFVVVRPRPASLEAQVGRGNSFRVVGAAQRPGLWPSQASCKRGPQPSQKSGPQQEKETPAMAHWLWAQQKAGKQTSQLGSQPQQEGAPGNKQQKL